MFGDRLRAARLAKGMKLREFARLMGVSAAFICEVEHNNKKLSEERIAQAVALLGVDFESLCPNCVTCGRRYE